MCDSSQHRISKFRSVRASDLSSNRVSILFTPPMCVPTLRITVYPRFASSVCVHPPDRPTTFRSVFACTISPSHRITSRSAARPRPSPSVRAYDHSSKQDSSTFAPSVCASFRLNTASLRSSLRSVSKYDSPSKRIGLFISPCFSFQSVRAHTSQFCLRFFTFCFVQSDDCHSL